MYLPGECYIVSRVNYFACMIVDEFRYYYDSGTLKITRPLENTPRALKLFNNYDYAFQKDVAVYFQTKSCFVTSFSSF